MRFPLRGKLVVLAILLAVVPLSLVGWALIDVNASTVATNSREIQVAVVDDLSSVIEDELEQAETGLDAVARVLADDSIQETGRLALAVALVEASLALDHAGIYDAEGAYIDRIEEKGAEQLEFPRTLPGEILEAARAERVATAAPERLNGAVRVLVVVPIGGRDAVTGYAASHLSLSRVSARVRVLADAHFAGVANGLFLVDDQLRILAHSDQARDGSLEVVEGEGILDGVDAGSFGRTFSKAGEFTGADGVAVVGVLRRLEARPWAIIAQVPRERAYASLNRMRIIVISTVAGLIIVALFAGVLGARRITSPLVALAEFAGGLAQRRFDQRIALDTGDELGVLAHAMSSAAAELEVSEAKIREQIEIRRDLGRYLPGELVEKVVAREQDMGLGGQRKEITVMFADVVAFTPLTEKLEPADVVQLLNELFTIATEIIFRHGGTVDKFVGDCVMAIWGAPTPQEDHAARALAAAEDILSWLEFGNEGWREKYGVEVQIAIGVNSGGAIVGNVGSKTRMEYTAIGDVVNVAARLEAIARPQQVLVTRETREAAGDAYDYVDLGTKHLSGRAEDIELYEVRT